MYLTALVGSVLQYVGLIFVTGMIAHVTAAAAIGRRLSLGEAWAATRGSRWRLLGLTAIIALLWISVLGLYTGIVGRGGRARRLVGAPP